MTKKLVAIDGYSLLHRAFFAMPGFTAPDGTPTGALTGFLNMFFNVLEQAEPDYALVAFDRKGGTFRNEMFEAYKANRPPMPDDLRVQVDLLKEVLDLLGIARVEAQGYEADDILGTYAALCEKESVDAVLVTGDRDSFQLIGDHVQVWMTRKGVSEIDVFDRAKLQEVYGLEPHQIVDLKGLMGDTSDNIPGVPKVGEKTALKLLAQFGSMENTLQHADEAGGPKLCENLKIYAEQARLSYTLATIRKDVPDIPGSLEPFAFAWRNSAELEAFFDRLRMRKMLEKVQSKAGAAETVRTVVPAVSVETETTNNEEVIRAWVESRARDVNAAVAVCITQDAVSAADSAEKALVLPIARDLFSENALPLDTILRLLEPLFAGECRKIVYDLKEWYGRLKPLKISISNVSADLLIAAYLLDATDSDYAQEKLIARYLNAEDAPNAAHLFALSAELHRRMEEEGSIDLYHRIELPLIDVLWDMEQTGFRVEKEALHEIGEMLTSTIDEKMEQIYAAAGHPFNLNSPKQLGVVLFEEMGLPVIKKTKKGYSTDADVLDQLRDQCPMVEDILTYRQYAKLKGTYVDGMLPLIDKEGRIHSTFNQTVTATGRISSSEPNLQNIPVRTEIGSNMRKIFCADGEDRVLVDADYSQIELRVLAHLSADEVLCEAFDKGLDIHRSTAANMWHVPLDAVTDKMRSDAKAINFGIVYGISDFGLSRNIGISRREAAEFIARYKDTYAGVTRYMDEMVEKARDLGYASTMFGRRRSMPELRSGNYNTRNFGARVAMNMPIQGTAADIIKLAMIEVSNALKGTDAKLILQVHDELIVDCPEDAAEETLALLIEKMRGVVDLRVPLVVDGGIGKTWYDAK